MISYEKKYKLKVNEVQEKIKMFKMAIKNCKDSNKKRQLQKEYKEYCSNIKY